MKGKINQLGQLEILRKNSWIIQECPFDKNKYCCHKCPMFDEPYEDEDEDMCIDICHSDLCFDDFSDERF